MTASLQTLERRRERAPRRFGRGLVIGLAGVAMGIGSMFVSPAFKYGPGPGETVTPEQEAKMDEPIPLIGDILLIGFGVLVVVGGEEVGFGAFEMSDVYEDKIRAARERQQVTAPAA